MQQRRQIRTDYETYREIMGELMRPIAGEGLDDETLRRLCESKLVYLENLRAKCFWELNTGCPTHFTKDDHALIINATLQTKTQLRQVVWITIVNNLSRRKVS